MHHCNVTQQAAAFPSALLLLRQLAQSYSLDSDALEARHPEDMPLVPQVHSLVGALVEGKEGYSYPFTVILVQVSCWRGCTP